MDSSWLVSKSVTTPMGSTPMPVSVIVPSPPVATEVEISLVKGKVHAGGWLGSCGTEYFINAQGAPDSTSAEITAGQVTKRHPCCLNADVPEAAQCRNAAGAPLGKCPKDQEVGLWPCAGTGGQSDFGWISRCCPNPSSLERVGSAVLGTSGVIRWEAPYGRCRRSLPSDGGGYQGTVA